jgi:hypothetical protein
MALDEKKPPVGGALLDLNLLEVRHRVVRQLLAARSELRGAASASTCRRDCQFPEVYDAIEQFMDRDMVRLIGEVVALLYGPAGPLTQVPSEASRNPAAP